VAAEFCRRERLLRGSSQIAAISKDKEVDGVDNWGWTTGDGSRVAAILQWNMLRVGRGVSHRAEVGDWGYAER
jgi:hypothetical protein